jgi:hypothetical protein
MRNKNDRTCVLSSVSEFDLIAAGLNVYQLRSHPKHGKVLGELIFMIMD